MNTIRAGIFPTKPKTLNDSSSKCFPVLYISCNGKRCSALKSSQTPSIFHPFSTKSILLFNSILDFIFPSLLKNYTNFSFHIFLSIAKARSLCVEPEPRNACQKFKELQKGEVRNRHDPSVLFLLSLSPSLPLSLSLCQTDNRNLCLS